MLGSMKRQAFCNLLIAAMRYLELYINFLATHAPPKYPDITWLVPVAYGAFAVISH